MSKSKYIKPTSVVMKNDGYWNSRILVGTPATGLVRMEWVMARYGQILPTNWSQADVMQYMSSYVPIRYQIADAENLIAKALIEGNWEWLLFIEADNVLPPETFVKLNEYMIKKTEPVVGGLYFTKSVPPEPMVYRDLGKGYYADWKLGDKVRVSGLPFGCTLIHASLIKAIWDVSEEYMVGTTKTRRVFKHPDSTKEDTSKLDFAVVAGTTDLNFFKEVKERKILEKTGWTKHAKMKHPFLVDTRIFVKHIDNDGVMWPISLAPDFLNGKKPLKDFL